ncbi:MAG: hypothetical protein HY036_02615 [Nitrospirae bacterium]|nr:hypothetical protein [Nitrospirota bacterium]MBI3351449.1 hypothetical protein [Nitrospirota bacterium]
MFSVKKTISGILLILSLGSTGCGLPPGPNTAPNFATISSQTIILPNPATGAINSRNPQIAIDPSGIYVVWEDKTNSNILFSSSTNDGSSFQTPIAIPGSSGGVFPRIKTDGTGNAYVIWQSGTRILLNYTTSSAFQTTLQVSTQAVPFSQSGQGGAAPPADIAYDSGSNSLYVSWTQCSTCQANSTINDIYYASIPITNPLSVSTPVKVTDNTTGAFLGYPKITVFGGIPYMVYQSTISTSGLYLSKATPPVITSLNVSGSQATASSAALGVDSSGNSYVSWNPAQSGSDVYFNTLKTNSPFNSIPVNLSNNGSSYGPAIALDSSQYVYVAFFSIPGGQTKYDVFLTRTTNTGSTFSGAFNISNTSGGDSFSYAPGMAIVGKAAYFVWDDNSVTGGNYQIFFQKVTLN